MADSSKNIAFDVVVVGSGAGAMVAALRAHELGLSVVVIEKAAQYGGTTASSGGCIWIPLNEGVPDDTPDKALTYLRHIVGPAADANALGIFVATAAGVTKHLERYGLRFQTIQGYPDYYSDAPGGILSRSMMPENMDGKLLGDAFFHMRDNNPLFLGMNRYALDFPTAGAMLGKMPGWQRTGMQILARYWLDIPWRLRTRRDRRLVLGRALVGRLRKAMLDRKIPLWLNTALVDLEKRDGRIAGALCRRHGNIVRIGARRGVILAAGGYEHNQGMRDQYLPIPVDRSTSLSAGSSNQGDAIRIGEKAGGALDGMSQVWWAPCVRLPLPGSPNIDATYGLIFERGRPGSLIVNRLGERYTNEAASYDRFGLAMIEEEKRTGAANPSWMIFDADFRRMSPVGAMEPGWIMPDRKVPGEWWDTHIYRAASLRELAGKIDVPERTLLASLEKLNRFARSGVDEQFGRGGFAYDQFLAQYGYTPNGNLGPVEKPPFYAVRVELGDLGTKGGLKVGGDAEVLDPHGAPVPGLYAVGNSACSLFGHVYPGAGATLGPAITFGFHAASHIAGHASSSRKDILYGSQ